ncbi:methyl-accepting chemotaxis protein, partial [Vibrio fortis]
LNNAKLTQNVLEQVKLLSYSTQSSDFTQLNSTKSSIQTLSDDSNAMLQELLLITEHFPEAISPQEKEQLLSDMTQLQAMTSHVLTMQIGIQAKQSVINKQVEPFRYGVSSAGPEMSRISSFLAEGNPESTDAANRFVSSVSAMESSFLMLMM